MHYAVMKAEKKKTLGVCCPPVAPSREKNANLKSGLPRPEPHPARRLLLLLAHFGKERIRETVVPKISQETLAEMIGTTRSRVSLLDRFRKLGFIQYNGGMEVHSSLLNVVPHD